MRITGKVSKVLPSKGDKDIIEDGQSRNIAWDNVNVTVLVDGLDSVEVKFKRDQYDGLPKPLSRGDDVTLDVDVPKGTRLVFVGAPSVAAARQAG